MMPITTNYDTKLQTVTLNGFIKVFVYGKRRLMIVAFKSSGYVAVTKIAVQVTIENRKSVIYKIV